MTTAPTYTLDQMTLMGIAGLIEDDWKNVNFAARPYLDAMHSLRTVDDYYYADTGSEIVMRFLGNAQSWRGDTARAVKAELKKRIK